MRRGSRSAGRRLPRMTNKEWAAFTLVPGVLFGLTAAGGQDQGDVARWVVFPQDTSDLSGQARALIGAPLDSSVLSSTLSVWGAAQGNAPPGITGEIFLAAGLLVWPGVPGMNINSAAPDPTTGECPNPIDDSSADWIMRVCQHGNYVVGETGQVLNSDSLTRQMTSKAKRKLGDRNGVIGVCSMRALNTGESNLVTCVMGFDTRILIGNR
jgi:hypothetical protein